MVSFNRHRRCEQRARRDILSAGIFLMLVLVAPSWLVAGKGEFRREIAFAHCSLTANSPGAKIDALLQIAGITKELQRNEMAKILLSSSPQERLSWARGVLRREKLLENPIHSVAGAILLDQGTTQDLQVLRVKMLDVETRRLAGRLKRALNSSLPPKEIQIAACQIDPVRALGGEVSTASLQALYRALDASWKSYYSELKVDPITGLVTLADESKSWWPELLAFTAMISQEEPLTKRLFPSSPTDERAIPIGLLCACPPDTTVGKVLRNYVQSYLQETSPVLVSNSQLASIVLDYFMMQREIPKARIQEYLDHPEVTTECDWIRTPYFFLPHYEKLLWLYVRAGANDAKIRSYFHKRVQYWQRLTDYWLRNYGMTSVADELKSRW